MITKISWLLQVVKEQSINIFNILAYLSQNMQQSTIQELQFVYQYYNLEYFQDPATALTVSPLSRFHEDENYTDLLFQLSKAIEDQGSFTLTLTSLLPMSFLFLSFFNPKIIWTWPFLVLLTFFLLQILNSSHTGLAMKLQFSSYSPQIDFLKRLKHHSLYETSPHKILLLADNNETAFNLFQYNDLLTLLNGAYLTDPVLRALVHQILLLPDNLQRVSILENLITKLNEINALLKNLIRDQTLIKTRFLLMQAILSFGLGIISFLIPFFALLLQLPSYPPLLFHAFFLTFLVTQPIYSETPLHHAKRSQILALIINLSCYLLSFLFASVLLHVS